MKNKDLLLEHCAPEEWLKLHPMDAPGFVRVRKEESTLKASPEMRMNVSHKKR